MSIKTNQIGNDIIVELNDHDCILVRTSATGVSIIAEGIPVFNRHFDANLPLLVDLARHLINPNVYGLAANEEIRDAARVALGMTAVEVNDD